jgi:SPP1 gp7 family putative phage head morphogenesis protein
METNSQELDHLKLAAFERVLNDKLTGSSQERHRVKVLPEGFHPVEMKSIAADYKSDYDEFIIKRIGSAFGVAPSQLGVFARAGLGGGKGSQEGESDNAETVSKKPMENFIVEVINSLCRRYLDSDRNITFVLDDGVSGKSAEEQAKSFQTSLNAGFLTLNDVRGEIGMPLYDMPEADEPLIVAGSTIQFLKGMLETDGAGETVGQKENPLDETSEISGQLPEKEAESAVSENKPEIAGQVEDELKAFLKYANARIRKGGNYRDFLFKTINEEDAYAFNQDVISIIKGDTYTPPKGVQEAAKRALEWIADGKAGDGFTDVGRKRASDLARGAGVSMATLKRMKAFFDRHQVDKDATGFRSGEDGYPSPGRVAWDAWGGDAGYSWARGIVGEEKAQISDNPKDVSVTKRKIEDLPGHRLKELTIHHYAPLIAKALSSGYSGLEKAVSQSIATHPAGGVKGVAKIIAQQAVQHNVKFDSDKFEKVLTDLYADNGLIAMETNPVLQKGAGLTDDLKSLSGSIDWSTWKPGSPGAAAKVAGGGLKDLLDAASTTIRGIDDTTMARLGDLIANGLAEGAGAGEISDSLDALINDPARAEMIAITEGNRAYNASSLDSMRDADLPGWTWLAYDGACDDCANEEGNHDFGDEYPPLHPNCRCAVVGQSTVSADEISAEE